MAPIAVALCLLMCVSVGARADNPSPAAAWKAEIQINLCSDPAQIIRSLRLTPASTKPREAWYFDNTGLDLLRRGVIFRLRTSAKAPELTLKAANQECAGVKRNLLPAGEAKCEYDLHGTHLTGAVSVSRTLDAAQFDGLLAGKLDLAKLLSPAQIRFLRDGLAVWPLSADLLRLGPAQIETYTATGKPFVVEMWRLPSGRRYVELSQKTNRENALRLQDELHELLRRNGVQLCANQGSLAAEKLRQYLPPS